MFERFDQPATEVIKSAFAEAAELGDDAVGTEHLLLALATEGAMTARLLAVAGGPAADIRRVVATRHRPNRGRDQETLLASLGVDLAEIRQRAEETFGAESITRAAWRVRRPRPRHLTLGTWDKNWARTWALTRDPGVLPDLSTGRGQDCGEFVEDGKSGRGKSLSNEITGNLTRALNAHLPDRLPATLPVKFPSTETSTTA